MKKVCLVAAGLVILVFLIPGPGTAQFRGISTPPITPTVPVPPPVQPNHLRTDFKPTLPALPTPSH